MLSDSVAISRSRAFDCVTPLITKAAKRASKMATNMANAHPRKPAKIPKAGKTATASLHTRRQQLVGGGAGETVARWQCHSFATHKVLFIRKLRLPSDIATVAMSLGIVTPWPWQTHSPFASTD
jgi:hypothetical protein